MDDPEELRRFWTQENPEGNDPGDYVGAIGRSRILSELISDLPKGASILEVGCNVGRNLAWLRSQGWHDVTGVEINPHAVGLLRRTYPELSDATIHLGAAEDVLPGLPDNGFDLVFTMAVLEHIHPDSAVVFDRIAKLAPDVLAIEPYGHATHRQFAHDIPATFTSRGLRLVGETPVGGHPDADPAIKNYVAWRFRR